MSSGSYAQWQPTSGPEGGIAEGIIKVSSYLFVNAGPGGIFRFDDNGLTWAPANNGLPASAHCYALTSFENNVYVSIAGAGIYYSADFAESWTAINSGISATTSYALAVNGNDRYGASSEKSFYYSANHGDTWTLHQYTERLVDSLFTLSRGIESLRRQPEQLKRPDDELALDLTTVASGLYTFKIQSATSATFFRVLKE